MNISFCKILFKVNYKFTLDGKNYISLMVSVYLSSQVYLNATIIVYYYYYYNCQIIYANIL